MHTPKSFVLDRVAGLIGSLEHVELPASELEHLGHEREPVNGSVRAKRCQDFLAAL
jgi:hypothetical protein